MSVDTNEEEAQEGACEGMRVLSTTVDGDSLYMELASSDREELVSRGRTFAMAQVNDNPKYGSWARAGVEKVSSPVAFDPNDPENDPYAAVPKSDTVWHYRQRLRVTRSPV